VKNVSNVGSGTLKPVNKWSRWMHIFTITAGRTGTDWLASFISANLKIEAVHEHLGVDDFGTRTPDIRTMRHFNDLGMTPIVNRFWKGKFDSLQNISDYCETNHTLSKCGIIEYLVSSNSNINPKFLILRRGWEDLATSYFIRGDFRNYTIIWQWYLDYRYRIKIVDFESFASLGGMAPVFWYIAEMEARQEYYRQLYSNRFTFVDCQLEDMVTANGARALLRTLGSDAEPILPPKKNANVRTPSDEFRQQISAAAKKVSFDPTAIAASFIRSGRRLGTPSTVAMPD